MTDILHDAPPPGAWIQTFTGRAFRVLEPRAQDVSILDIAHHLSMLCRFAGGCSHFYSVGEHSLHVSHLVPKELALAGLLHDATEAYCVDLPRPYKRVLPEYKAIENKIAAVIGERFGIDPALFEHPDVKDADNAMLLREHDVLFGTAPYPWGPQGVEPATRKICCAPPHVVENSFMQRFHDLTDGKFADGDVPRIVTLQ